MDIRWSEEKNEILKANKDRNINFEIIKEKILNDDFLDIIQNIWKYSHQKIFIIKHNNYIYKVPFVENYDENYIFLKNAFQDRILNKKYN